MNFIVSIVQDFIENIQLETGEVPQEIKLTATVYDKFEEGITRRLAVTGAAGDNILFNFDGKYVKVSRGS